MKRQRSRTQEHALLSRTLKPKQPKPKPNPGLISLKDRAAQASTRPYERMETQVREPNVTGYFRPKMLLVDVSIEGPKNM